jgi:hypothetical protein
MTSQPGRVQAILAEFARIGVVGAEQHQQARAAPPVGQPAGIPHLDMLALLQQIPDDTGPLALRDAVIRYWDRRTNDRAPDA